MSAVAETLMTVEEFEKLSEIEMQRELVRGEVVEKTPPGENTEALQLLLPFCFVAG